MKTNAEKDTKNNSNSSFFQQGQQGFFSPNSTFFSPTIQTKLEVGSPNDKYEQEADAVADRVMRKVENPFVSYSSPIIQRKCATCEEEENKKIQRKCAECEKEEKLQRKSDSEGSEVSKSVENSLYQSKGGGFGMDKSTKFQMESAFNSDFSAVRIHNDSSSVNMNQELRAKAFTHQKDIYFNEGNYNPTSNDGKKLLAHELTHVVQQTGQINKEGEDKAKEVIPAVPKVSDINSIKSFVDSLKLNSLTEQYFIVTGNRIAVYDSKLNLKGKFGIKRPNKADVSGYFLGSQFSGWFWIFENTKDHTFFVKGKGKDFIERSAQDTKEGKSLADFNAELDINGWFVNQKEYERFINNSSDVGTIMAILPDGGSQAAKGVGENDEEKPPKPEWAKVFEKSMKETIDTTKKRNPLSDDIPDLFYFYYSKKYEKYKGYAAQKDNKDKEINQIYLEIQPKDPVDVVLTNIRESIRIQKLRSELDIKPSKDAKALKASFTWAFELKLRIEKLIKDEKAVHTNLYELPDKLSLITLEGNENNIYLKISIYAQNTDSVGQTSFQLKSGVLSDPLRKEMKPEQVLEVIKKAVKSLKGEAIKTEGREEKSFQYVKEAYPSWITSNIRNDGKTVSNASHDFFMHMDLKALEGTNLLHLVTLNMRTVYYSWDVYKIDDQLNGEQKENLSKNWKERKEQYLSYFKHSGDLKTKPLVNTKKLNETNAILAQNGLEQLKIDENIKRNDIESFKRSDIFYGASVSITPDAEFSLPDQEGDYLIYCRAQVEPTNDVYIRPSESFTPVNVVNGYDLAKETVDKPFNEISDLEKQIAEAKNDEEKKPLQDKLDRLNNRQKLSLPVRVSNDLRDASESIKIAKKIKKLYLDNKANTRAFSLIIADDKEDGRKMIDLWLMLAIHEPEKDLDVKIDEFIQNIDTQKIGIADLQKRLDSFKGDYDTSKPTYTPVVSLVSKVTGSEYQLITMVAETKNSTDTETEIVLIDVTTYKTQKKYYGKSNNKNKQEALKEAIKNAFDELGEEAKYGKGYIQYRVPVLNAANSANSSPGIKQRIIGVLETVAAVAGIAALVIGTVFTGGALAVAVLGFGSAIIGAGVAAHHIYDRYENHRLDLDVELALDILNVLGPLLMALNAAVRGAKFAAAAAGALESAEGIAKLNRLVKLGNGLAFYQKLELTTNITLINYKVVRDLQEIQSSNLTDDQKNAMTRQIILNALLANVMMAVAVRNELKSKLPPGEEALNALINNANNELRYKQQLKKAGLIDAEGKWTIPELNEAAAKSAPVEDPKGKPTEEIPQKATPEEPSPKANKGLDTTPKAKIEPDAYEKGRKVKMEGHAESPDKEHHVEAYPNKTVGRCSPVKPGEKCPILQIEFKEVLDKRPSIKKDLQDMLHEIAKLGENVPQVKMDELAALEQRLRNIQKATLTSSAPKNYKIKEVQYKDSADLSLPLGADKTLLEFPNGERVWRGADGAIHHEAEIGNSTGRQGYEHDFVTASESGIPTFKGTERAHSFGQGFGWESPFGLFQAPRFVNQKLQNNGIEQYIRSLRDLLPAGQKLVVHAATEAVPLSRRLKSISYEGFVYTATGEKIKAFTYKIEVTWKSAGGSIVDAPAIKYLDYSNPAHQKIIDDLKALIPQVNLPDYISKPAHEDIN